jgi:hypothetical protein
MMNPPAAAAAAAAAARSSMHPAGWPKQLNFITDIQFIKTRPAGP